MMGIVLIILCLLGGIQFSVAVDEITSEPLVSVANETNTTDIGHGEF